MKYFYDTRKDSYRFADESVNFFINVGLQVTRKCNLKCIYCSEADDMPDVSMLQMKNMIDRLIGCGLKRLCVTGGEPLLRKDLVEILKYAKTQGLTITLSTNGMNLTEKLLAELKPYVDNIRLSLRGPREMHDKITKVDGSFDKTLDGIKLAKKMGLPVGVIVTVISQNYHNMAELARLCEQNGVEKLYFFSLIPRGRAQAIFKDENVTIDRLTREYNLVMELAKKEGWNMDIKVANFTIEGECILVFPNGDVVGVPSFDDEGNQLILGNILRDDPKKLWEKYPFKENYINYYRNH